MRSGGKGINREREKNSSHVIDMDSGILLCENLCGSNNFCCCWFFSPIFSLESIILEHAMP